MYLGINPWDSINANFLFLMDVTGLYRPFMDFLGIRIVASITIGHHLTQIVIQ